MPRVKNSSQARHRKVVKQAKGYFGTKSTHFKKAKEQLMRAWASSYKDRKNNKRNFRALWITRINAAVRPYGLSYSQFIYGLNLLEVDLNRKMLSEIAIHNPKEFKLLVEDVKTKLSQAKTLH